MHVDNYIQRTHGSADISNLTRTVIEERQMPFREVDVFSRLMLDRIIFLGTPIDDYIASILQAQLLFLESSDAKADVQIYINSPGGGVYAGLGIYDTMQYISCDVATYCIGQAASMGALLLTAGAAGKRNALPNSRIMIHQPLAGMQGTATDLEIHAKEVLKMKRRLNEILLHHTGQTLEKIEQDTDRDNFMDAQEAKSYGLIDNVLEHLELPGTKE